MQQYLRNKGVTPTESERLLNWSNGSLTKPNSISADRAIEFLLFFKDLSAEWLMRGEGNMLRTTEDKRPRKINLDNYTVSNETSVVAESSHPYGPSTTEKEYIAMLRKKVAGNGWHEVKLTIQPEASAIINKYMAKNGRLKFDYKYSDVNLQRYINQCLKLLASELGIHGCVSFYSARKSFAQMAAELGISDAVIDYCLGHSDRNRGTIRFYTKVRQKQADIAVRRVIDYALNPSHFQEYIDLRMQVMMGLVV